MNLDALIKKYKNFIFIGEAGSGKSEIALNFADYISNHDKKAVHFFDMDMTKPLFRSRDLAKEKSLSKINFHYEEQFMDAPTLVGGVKTHLLDNDCSVIMDIGGDDIGSRAIGGFNHILKQDSTMIYYVINPYRPWSDTIEHIDMILACILRASRLELKNINIISNPNIGKDTVLDDVIKGHEKLQETLSEYLHIELLCIDKNLYPLLENNTISTFPIKRYIGYEWEN